MEEKEIVQVYTTAPEVYDYKNISEQVNSHAGNIRRGDVLRAVEIEKTRSVGQIMRYGSGLYVTYESGSFELHEALRFGQVILKPWFRDYETIVGWDGVIEGEQVC